MTEVHCPTCGELLTAELRIDTIAQNDNYVTVRYREVPFSHRCPDRRVT